ncbi:MAG TPA: type VI secretion system tube protein Hcp [Solirubrobacteraceae bacterium]|jgi:type VI secretion system secreted protein Hcp|nr:type VI secretion system tube protein Hcp [Solirubrobacteraceae bacterium]
MSVDFFLRVEGIEGESTAAKHMGEIDVLSWSWGASNPVTAGPASGSASGRVNIQDLHFTTRMSKASPRLFLACATGQHLKQARLSAVRAGEKAAEFFSLTLSDVRISSYQSGGSEGSDIVPMDQVSLNAAKLAIEYKAMRPDGTVEAPVVAGWDAKSGSKF